MGMQTRRRALRFMIACSVACMLVCVTHALAGATGPVDLPTPLRTKDLQKWITDVKPSDPQRVAMERAFDACVDQWTVLRDQTVRPAQGKLDAKSDDPAAEAAWRTTVARAFETTRGTERTMFDAMRAAGLSTEQTAALDRDADARTRTRASAVLGGVRVNLPRVPGLKQLPVDTQAAIDQKTRAWEVSATPMIDRLATANMDDKAADRAADLKRKLLASQRSAVRDIATLLPAPQAAQYMQTFRRQSLPGGLVWGGFGAPSPMSMRSSLDANQHKAALDKLDEWQKQRESMEEAAIEAMLSDSFTAETMKQMESQYAKLNSDNAADIAATAGMPELNAPGNSMTIDLSNGGEGIDLSELTGGEGTMVFSSINGDGPDGEGMSGMVASQAIVMVRGDAGDNAMAGATIQATSIQVIATSDGAPIDVSAPAPTANAIAGAVAAVDASALAESIAGATTVMGTDEGMPMPAMLGGRGAKPLSRQDIETLRTRLGVQEAQRAVWETLAADLLQSSADWMKASGENNMAPKPDQTADQFVAARAAHRAELARIEDTWFDNVKAGVQGVDAASLETARSRRALQRALGSIRGGSMMMPEVMMSRWLRVDLDKAADALSPTGLANCASPLQAWRSQMLTELAATQSHMDDMAKVQMSMMTFETVTDDQGNANVRMGMNYDEKQAETLQRAREPLQAVWKRVEQTQAASIDTVAAALPESDAKAFRRAIRQQTHPEAFRSQEKVDAAIARVLNLPNLSPEQLQGIGTLADTYRDRSDALVNHSILQADRNDSAVAGLMDGGPSGVPPDQARMNQKVKAMETTDRARNDAAYDREELNARALRQLRATLTPQQSQAAKLN
jgi:hypothetical protein